MSPRAKAASRAKRASVLEQRAAQPLATTNGAPARGDRIGVRKTYKLYIGGAFPRTESGRSYEVFGAKGQLLANASRGTRKDIREAVVAARKAFGGWAARTAYNRSQVLYRIAELMEGRRDQFTAEVMAAEGISRARATRNVDAAIDRWVWYAGWADKYPQMIGTVNPVAGPYFNFSVPEPTGVVGIIAPEESSLLGLVSRLAPAVVSGNAAVVVSSESRPLPAVTLTEVLATSDVPGGVVNLITGLRRELVGHLAGHMDVNALDAFGAATDEAATLEEIAVENVKRFVRPPSAGLARYDWMADSAQSPYLIGEFVEVKTVWHPIGA
ncbi:MAG: aldehyde dehydrogenase family protein [Chloroflexi bacterium]|nr:aldehyde dehydrogenase family protein [Chloroflexota bacterium]MBA3740083.1 aldehyde dehydrogenase family protein [Chloroflexota bacterium]